jgi:uncharacterized protein YggE
MVAGRGWPAERRGVPGRGAHLGAGSERSTTVQKIGIVALGLAGVIALGGAAPRAFSADGQTASQRSITVSAEGQVTVAPDVAFVTVGVQQTELQASKAQDEANTITAAVIARIKALGIPDRDIQTQSISLDPQYDDRGIVTGFTASDTLSITVEHPRQAGAVIDAGVAAGANRNVSVSFGLKDDSVARSAALRAAVAVAQRKAATVAAQLGISLVGAKVQVTENVAQTPVPYLQNVQNGSLAPSRAAPTPVQTGSLTVQDSVTVTYTL